MSHLRAGRPSGASAKYAQLATTLEPGERRFVELLPTVLVPLIVYLHTQLGECSGISFIDSTALAVCKNPRIHQHRVFALDARRGKTEIRDLLGEIRHRSAAGVSLPR